MTRRGPADNLGPARLRNAESLCRAHGGSMQAHAYRDGTLGGRARARLRASDDFDDLMLLGDLVRRGRQPGAIVCELAEALDYIRALDDEG